MVVVADKTSELYQKTYWASYNLPYVPTPAHTCLTPTQFSMLVRGSSLRDLFNPQSKETILAFLWPGVVGLWSAPTAGGSGVARLRCCPCCFSPIRSAVTRPHGHHLRTLTVPSQ